jgi:hypothetical protein
MGQRRLTSPSPQRANVARILSPNNQNLIYDPNTRSFRPEAELLSIEQRVQDAANREFRRKRKVASGAGTHLSQGTAGGRPKGTFVDAMEAASEPAPKPVELPAPIVAPIPQPAPEPVPATVPDIPVQSPVRKKKKKVVASDSEISDQGSYGPNSSDTDSDIPLKQTFNTRAGVLLAKKPSIVREDREREEEEDGTPDRLKQNGTLVLDTSPASARTISPSPLPRSVAGRGHGRGQASASAAFAQHRQHTRSASQPAIGTTDSSLNEDNTVSLVAKDGTRGGRVQSVSPVRTTHFANAPDSLLVKHQPPARSISPRKSALKHSSSISPRGSSPIEGMQTEGAQNQDFSEAPVASTIPSEDLAPPKRKGNRVSFDESHVLVGQAASPVVTDSPMVQSPQTKRPWYSIGRGKKKEASVVDEDDEVMKPRPALPSFGSVRERKVSRETAEERPLVKPAEPSDTKVSETKVADTMPSLSPSLPPNLPSPLSPPLFTISASEFREFPLSSSSDHAVGAIISQDATSKNEANISKSREPLPPQVTSVEGTGYHSDSDSSVYDSENRESDIGIVRANSVKRGPEGASAETYRALTSPIPELDTPVEEKPEKMTNGDVPEITVLQATPTLEITDAGRGWPDMPGAWASSTDDSSGQEFDEVSHTVPEAQVTESCPANVGIAEPSPVVPPSITIPSIDPIPRNPSPVPAILEELEESDTSVYSDAVEELSDVDGDGFMSLDAVVESPVTKTPVMALAIPTPPDSPTTRTAKERAYQNQLLRQNSEPDIDAGWDKVQEYWSTLSADKKRRLESEARVEGEGEGSDTEVEVQPAPKPTKKKKKVISQPASTPASPPTPAPASGPIAQTRPQEKVVTSQRSYMIQPGSKVRPNGYAPPMRSSMRGEPTNSQGDSLIRKSMRGPGSMRSSLRADAPEPKGSLQKRYRPMSLPAGEIKADPAAVNMHIDALSAASARLASKAAQLDTAPAPTLRRKGSGDSESSFKRSRAPGDLPNFRRSMRTSTDQDSARGPSPMRSSRFSLRSLSPTGSGFQRPFNSSNSAPPASLPQSHMRSSMRSYSSETPSLRNNNAPRTGVFGRPSGSKTRAKAVPRSSRFADSSDEEDDRPNFQSRFDSSDEEEPVPLSGAMPRTMRSATAREAPKLTTVNDGDSSDLSDSDDERPQSSGLKLRKRGQNGHATTAGQGTDLAAGTLRRSGSGRETISSPITTSAPPARPAHNRRGSIMSILRRKKPDQGSKVRKSDLESAARRDTPLERSRSDLAAIRQDRPPTPKLQKRNTGNSGSWPLATPASLPKTTGNEDDRPFTTDNGDGVVGAHVNGNANGDARPDIGTRRFTATGLADVDLGGKTRKKKFPKLRKMFRLED